MERQHQGSSGQFRKKRSRFLGNNNSGAGQSVYCCVSMCAVCVFAKALRSIVYALLCLGQQGP